MTVITPAIISAALPWAIMALSVAAAVVLLPPALLGRKTSLAVVRTNLFATTPVSVAIFSALAAGPATTAAEGGALGAVVGAGALLGTTVGLTLLGVAAGSTPAVQDFVRASEPHPEARLPYHWIAPLGTATGAFAGLMLGLGNLALAVLVGMVVGAS